MNNQKYNFTSSFGNFSQITQCVKFLLIINISVYLGELIFKLPFLNWFSLPAIWWMSLDFTKLFSYMFVHGGFSHLLVNMLGLFFIGPVIERTIGPYKFFILYYMSGILGGLAWSLITSLITSVYYPGSYCVGASGAVMGILGAFGALYPNVKLLLWFFLPVRAWILVLGLIIWELSETVGNPNIGGIANAAHLVGVITGVIYALFLKYDLNKRTNFKNFNFNISNNFKKNYEFEKPSEDEINRILDKIGKQGIGSLTK
ncbi:MAG: rhomboid family intramembrane serine protease, partial [Verrucomicrobiota bacterium]|nr:rhomboid family intramembrane serine protease [Verrucomicrobiota bacterium]